MTDTINHYPIVLQTYVPAAHPRDLHSRVVLVDRGERRHGRYVTAVQYSVDSGSAEWQSGWEHGHYHCGLDDARADYVQRVIQRAGGAS